MSQIVKLEDSNDVQYIYDSELILDPSNVTSEGLSDVVYSDGTRAFLVNGNLLQSNGQTIVLQEGEDLTRYFVNDSEQILVADDTDILANTGLEGAEIIQYIDDGSSSNADQQVIYVTNDESFGSANEEGTLLENYEIANFQDNEELDLENSKRIKLESSDVDLEDFIKQNNDTYTTAVEEKEEPTNLYQYAVLKDGKLHIQSYNPEEVLTIPQLNVVKQDPENPNGINEEQFCDLAKITGKNLLTGQVVSLHSYMEKIQQKLKSNNLNKTNRISDSIKKEDCDTSLLNKKIELGTTQRGKKLVGKIIQIQKKSQEPELIEQLPTENLHEDQSLLVAANASVKSEESKGDFELTGVEVQKEDGEGEVSLVQKPVPQQIVPKETFEQISRTLGGLMNMDTVKKKLQLKNVIVKVVEKKYNAEACGLDKNIFYCLGYMEEEYLAGENGEIIETWAFVPESKEQRELIGYPEKTDKLKRYVNNTNLTIFITQEKNGERVTRVVLNSNENRCSICFDKFPTVLQLRLHIQNVHATSDQHMICEICNTNFLDLEEFTEHRNKHIQEGLLFECEFCKKTFLTAGRLKRHWNVHKNHKPLKCSVCDFRYANASLLKKHLMTHMNIKPFTCMTCLKTFTNTGDLNMHQRIHDPSNYFPCDVCGRAFSRLSNLQRHSAIHKGDGALYNCDICGCSYHYVSSLTRHMVVSHINVGDKIAKEFEEK